MTVDNKTRRRMIELLNSDEDHRTLLTAIKDPEERRKIKALTEDYYVNFLGGLLDVQKLIEVQSLDLSDLSDGDIPKKEDGR